MYAIHLVWSPETVAEPKGCCATAGLLGNQKTVVDDARHARASGSPHRF